MNATSLRKGMVIKHDGELYQVHDFQRVKPGKGGAFVQTSLKNVKRGNIVKVRFRSSDDVEAAEMDSRRVQYLYNDGNNYYFMDMKDYNTFDVSSEVVGKNKDYLKEELMLEIDFHEANPIAIELPTSVALKVEKTDPGVKGDSVSTNTKPATLETGLVVQVPLFINEGELLQIDTRTGEYMGRA